MSAVLRFTADGFHYLDFPKSVPPHVCKFRYRITERGLFLKPRHSSGWELVVTEERDGTLALLAPDGRCDWIRRKI